MIARKKRYDYTAELVTVITSKPWPIEPRFRRILRKLVREAATRMLQESCGGDADARLHKSEIVRADRIAKELVP